MSDNVNKTKATIKFYPTVCIPSQ